jgi:hypothetical protein
MDTHQQIKVNPSLAQAALQKKQQRQLALWLIARQLDRTGRGWVDLGEFYQKAKELGWWDSDKPISRAIESGVDVWWYKAYTVKGQKRLPIASLKNVCLKLGIRLSYTETAISMRSLKKQQAFKAQLFSAFFVGRRSRIYSLTTLVDLFGHSKRAIRRWCKMAGIEMDRNFAVAFMSNRAEEVIACNAHEHRFFECTCGYRTVDIGKALAHAEQEHPGVKPENAALQVVWQLPNRYTSPLPEVASGHTKYVRIKMAKAARIVGMEGSAAPDEMGNQSSADQPTRRKYCTGGTQLRRARQDDRGELYLLSPNRRHGAREWRWHSPLFGRR